MQDFYRAGEKQITFSGGEKKNEWRVAVDGGAILFYQELGSAGFRAAR